MPYYVNWDNGSEACGTFPQAFDTEAEAQAFADHWAEERNLEDLGLTSEDVEDRGGEGCYTAEVIEVEPENPEICECGRPWNDCATRDGEEQHRDR
jgi:hypothetical protein